jgi:hypothetical protein
MKKLKLLFVGMLVLGFAVAASADRIPGDCTGNAILVEIFRPEPVVNAGGTIEYTVVVTNPGAPQCQKTDLALYFFPPNVTPDDVCRDATNGTLIVSGLTLDPGEFADFNSADNAVLAYTTVPADAPSVVAFACVFGDSQSIPGDVDTADGSADITTLVNNPAIQIAKAADPCEICEGEPGTEVTYTYWVSWGAGGDVNLVDVEVTDDNCSPVTYDSGDDGDDVLEEGEVWEYECVKTLTEAVTNTATVDANDQDLGTHVTDQNTAEVTADNPVCEDFTGDIEELDCNETGYSLCISASGGVEPYTYEWTSSDDTNWPITAGDANCITYSSGPGGSNTVMSVVITDALDCNVVCEQPLDCIPEPPPPGDTFCSFTQGFWGNANGRFDGNTTEEWLVDYFQEEPNLTIGACDNTVTLSDAQCVLDRMPAGGRPRCLEGLGNVDDDCPSNPTNPLKKWLKGKAGRYNNVLMGQVIALTLNMWVDPNLGHARHWRRHILHAGRRPQRHSVL